jgi:hypothetical protein
MERTGINRYVTPRLNDVNDPSPGVSVANSVQAVPGQLGAVMTLNAADALKASDTTVGTLYEGSYQYVQFYASQSGTTVAQGPMYWQDPDNFVVTADVPTNGAGFAGIALNVVTKGNYGWIQVSGKATLNVGTVTKATPAIGDPVSTSTIGIFDDVDTTPTALIIARYVGVWIVAPATSTPALAWFDSVKNARVQA